MKASKLIEELQKLIRIHGDKIVNFESGYMDSSIGMISVYDKNGEEPSEENKAAEFYLHRGSSLILKPK